MPSAAMVWAALLFVPRVYIAKPIKHGVIAVVHVFHKPKDPCHVKTGKHTIWVKPCEVKK